DEVAARPFETVTELSRLHDCWAGKDGGQRSPHPAMKSTSVILSAASLLCLSSAHAAISFTGIHSESFDSLPSAGEAAIEGTSAVGNQVAVPGLANWQLAKVGGSATGNSSIHTSQLTGGRFYS